MTLEEFANCTDRQLVDLYCHPRDKDGKVQPKNDAADLTPEQADQLAFAIASAFGADTSKIRETIAKREAEKRGD